MDDNLKTLLRSIPQQPQRQDSETDQMRDLVVVANRLGMYDASTFVTACDPHLVFRIRRGQEFDLPVTGLEYDRDALNGDAQAFL